MSFKTYMKENGLQGLYKEIIDHQNEQASVIEKNIKVNFVNGIKNDINDIKEDINNIKDNIKQEVIDEIGDITPVDVQTISSDDIDSLF